MFVVSRHWYIWYSVTPVQRSNCRGLHYFEFMYQCAQHLYFCIVVVVLIWYTCSYNAASLLNNKSPVVALHNSYVCCLDPSMTCYSCQCQSSRPGRCGVMLLFFASHLPGWVQQPMAFDISIRPLPTIHLSQRNSSLKKLNPLNLIPVHFASLSKAAIYTAVAYLWHSLVIYMQMIEK